MTSDDHDKKVRLAKEKGERLYERLGPDYRAKYSREEFIDYQRIEKDPDREHANFGRTSGAADFNKSQVGSRQGGGRGGKAKAELHKHYEQVLVDLARPFATKLNSRQLSLNAVAQILKTRGIPNALETANKEGSPNVEALEHLNKLSQIRIYNILRKHKESVSASP